MTLLLLRHTSKRALYGTACTENLQTTESPYPDQKAPSINFLIPSIILFVPAYRYTGSHALPLLFGLLWSCLIYGLRRHPPVK